MAHLMVVGGSPLSGSIPISGAKNSVLPLLAASLLFRGGCEIHNCPHLTDVEAAVEILRHLGCQVAWEDHTIRVEAKELIHNEIPQNMMTKMRSSILFLGPLMARLGSCWFTQPGGCSLGARPIDLHLRGLQTLGAVVSQVESTYFCSGKLHGEAVILPKASVGATENLILAALGASGVTTIVNAAREPEICDLIGFLQAGGAKIDGAGTSVIQITGGLPEEAVYSVLPDRMEAATFLAACACAGGSICLQRVEAAHLQPVLQALEAAGCRIQTGRQEISIQAGPLRSIPPVCTAPYPGFPTDAQATMMAAMLRADGVTVFQETVFSNRYRHVPAFRALGADIRISGSIAVVTGVAHLHAATMEATDLRGGAAMVLAALGAEGESTVGGIDHMLRGYENFSGRLEALGAQVNVIPDSYEGVCNEKRIEQQAAPRTRTP